jgi:AcrR family transcriptional regulator
MSAKNVEPTTAGGQQMRERIRAAAIDLFAEKSFSGTSMADIAEACGITKAGLYYYFKTKTDLLDYVYETVNESLALALSHASDKGVSTEQRLGEIVHAQVSHQVEYRLFLSVFWRERYQLEPEARRRVRARERRFEATMRDLLLEGQADGTFGDFDLALRVPMIFGVLNTIHRWSHRIDRSVDQISDEVLDLILDGSRKRPNTSSKPNAPSKRVSKQVGK